MIVYFYGLLWSYVAKTWFMCYSLQMVLVSVTSLLVKQNPDLVLQTFFLILIFFYKATLVKGFYEAIAYKATFFASFLLLNFFFFFLHSGGVLL